MKNKSYNKKQIEKYYNNTGFPDLKYNIEF